MINLSGTRQVIKSSHILYEFYKDWLNAATKGTSKCVRLLDAKRYGLCTNLGEFLDEYEGSYLRSVENSNIIKRELKKQFIDAGLDNIYPFGLAAYDKGMIYETMHQDTKRIQWVRDRIEDGVLEDANSEPSDIGSGTELAKDS